MGNLLTKYNKNKIIQTKLLIKNRIFKPKTNEYLIYINGPELEQIRADATEILFQDLKLSNRCLIFNLYVVYNTDYIQSIIKLIQLYNPTYINLNNFNDFIKYYYSLGHVSYSIQDDTYLNTESDLLVHFLHRLLIFTNNPQLVLINDLRSLYNTDIIINHSFYRYKFSSTFEPVKNISYINTINTKEYSTNYKRYELMGKYFSKQYIFDFFTFIKKTKTNNLELLFKLIINFIEYILVNNENNYKLLHSIRYYVVINFYHYLEDVYNSIYITIATNIQQICIFLLTNNFFDIDFKFFNFTDIDFIENSAPANIFDIMIYHYSSKTKPCIAPLELINYKSYSNIKHCWLSAVIRYTNYNTK